VVPCRGSHIMHRRALEGAAPVHDTHVQSRPSSLMAWRSGSKERPSRQLGDGAHFPARLHHWARGEGIGSFSQSKVTAFSTNLRGDLPLSC
jgi:hypothetical protein